MCKAGAHVLSFERALLARRRAALTRARTRGASANELAAIRHRYREVLRVLALPAHRGGGIRGATRAMRRLEMEGRRARLAEIERKARSKR